MSAAPIRILRSFATVGGWTMASRVLGFVRDVGMANVVGTGPIAEAFFVAFRLPNMFRRFFAEGAFNTAFVPMFTRRVEEDGKNGAHQFGTEALSMLFATLLAVTILAQIAMPWLVLGLASGFGEGERFDLAVLFSRIIFPYIVLISLAALFSGVLNAFGHFAAAAAAPVLLNVIWIATLGLLWLTGWNTGITLSCAIVVGGVAQLALVWLAARRLGMGLVPRRPRMTPQVRKLIRIGIPAALAGGVLQINLLVGTQVASYFEGAVGWLWYADRIYQLPLGVVGVAIGVVLLPDLTRRFRADDSAGTAHAMNRAAEFCLVLTIPATIALIAIPALLTAGLFQHGAFSREDTAATALALSIYAVGLPSFVLQKVLQPAYFSREDTRTPLRCALWSMVVNVVLAIGLSPVFGFAAAAVGTTLAGWVNLWLLWRGVLRLDPEYRADSRLLHRAPRILAASLIMGAGVFSLGHMAEIFAVGFRTPILFGTIVVGIGLFAVAGAWLGAFSPAEIRGAMRRKRG